ncbi:glycosyltransferase family 4 protein [Parathielavia appendiculata]|uniref:Glycosyltransferase family 4 protein n=1 Tax=Parathielavia appendiculata TaxID=2587402 RepID=A0AAN6U5J9_9PEZI|nr:glycosyltransferase family 4 protein [Parathielavia appendiculata]
MDTAPTPYSIFPDALRGKRILLCTESFGPVNGVSRTTLMLVNHLRSNGVDVAVVAPHTRETTFTPEQAPLQQQQHDLARTKNTTLRISGFPLPYNPELTIAYPVRLSTLYSRAFGPRAPPPDLIYLASPASLGFQVMLQLRNHPSAHRPPLLANFQTDLAGYCAILFPAPFSTVAVAALAFVQSYLFNHASVRTVFYPSRFVRRILEGWRVESRKLSLLQRGVDTALFHPSRRRKGLRGRIAPNGEIVLICVSRLAGEKGFGFLAGAVRELDRRGLRFVLYVVGGNRNAAVEEEIKALFDARLREAGRVVFAGFCAGEKLAEAYASADVFLHCSVTETFGLVVLESMASGVPVVARDEGGPSDIVRDGVTGYLTPPEDVAGFVDKVMVLATDDALRKQMGENARRQAEEATWERINNRVAWRMVEAIEQSERERAELRARRERLLRRYEAQAEERTPLLKTTPISEWLLPTATVQARVADVRVAGGMVAISATWVAVGAYLVFIKAGLWMKARARSWSGLWRGAQGVASIGQPC